MWYFVVFLSSLATDLVPLIGPPAWTLMVLFRIKFDLNPWLVLLAGVPGSTLGRFLLSCYIPKLSDRFIKKHKKDELHYLGKQLGQGLWRSWLFILIYSLTPLSTTALFTAAGIAKIRAIQIIPPFFVGKFICDAIMLFTGSSAVHSATELAHSAFSWKGVLSISLGLLMIGILLFVDWFVLLQKKKVVLRFHIWK